ncbi:MAG: methylenetetrahydrofolate reductase [Firmicutes bacterium]|nr:methylenetetrahydrofolate reductase [NAD(P)H] [Bacillota bacterium]
MKISDIYKTKRQALSFEIFPPKKEEELRNIGDTLDVLAELKPDFISVTFGAGGSANNNRTIEIAKMIKNEYKIEPLVHLTCLCYDRHEIDEFVKALEAEGIENILALRGDKREGVPAKDDFAHANDLISYLKEKTDFCVAGACYPEVHPETPNGSRIAEVKNLRKKVTAGADFLLSQLFFDNNNFYKMLDECKIADIDVPVTPGIMPVTTAASINRMVNLCGAVMPDSLGRVIARYADNKEGLFDAGMAYAINQIIDLLANGVDGIHLYTMNNPTLARRICSGIKNLI